MPICAYVIVGILAFFMLLLVITVMKMEKEIEEETGLTWQDIVRLSENE